jgi:REP element-mobilizing transposase RayT
MDMLSLAKPKTLKPMANTYRKIHLQVVFAVKNREALLHKSWRPELFKYIAGIINQRKHYSLAVNGIEDHIHLFFDYNGRELIEDLVREIKKASSRYIKEKQLSPFKFEWQSGYGVFSHGYREKSTIIDYVKNQESHHQTKSFREEYLAFLNSYEIEFKEEYVFDFLE